MPHRRLPAAGLAFLLAVLAVPAPARAQDGARAAGEAHPLIGTWRWVRKENRCTETYEFRTDGTAYVVSGAERSDNRFTVSKQPDAKGFYKLDMTITKDHGGKDCADADTDDTGHESTTYLLFEPTKEMYLSCAEPSLGACFGPLKRTSAK